jgi:hypothetical protein
MKTDIAHHEAKPAVPQPSRIRALAHHVSAAAGYICNPLVLTDRVNQQRAVRFLARLRRSIPPVIVLFVLVYGVRARAAGITATLEPTEISLGEAAQLTVSIQGQDDAVPEIPAVNGLSFQHVAQSSQIQVINGVMTANVSHTYAVVPSRDGTFTIPEIRIGSGREAAASQPVVLKVVKRGNSGSLPLSGGAGSSPASGGNPGDENVSVPDKNSFGFLRVVSPKTEFFVGEMVPVELRAYFRAGVELRVDGLPQLNSDAFAMNKLSGDPVRSRQIIDGIPYTVFSWPTAVTALKAGDYELGVELPVTVTVRERVAPRRSRGTDPFDDFFDDAFFSNFFGAATQKQVALNSQPAMAKILPLPTENRPAHFAGTVGKFFFSAGATPAQVTVGDPVTLKLTVSGSGNFDRVLPPALAADDAWKSYKPGAKFSPTDGSGCAGEKVFEQILVPARSGQLEIPALAFSYFDPEKRQYITCRSQPLGIKAAPGQADGTVPAPTPPAGTGMAVSSTPALAAPVSDANRSAMEARGLTLKQWLLDPWFVSGALLTIAGFAAWRFLHRRRRPADDSRNVHRAETRRAVAIQLETMESAMDRGAASVFFAAARRALQIQLGVLWNLPPQTITQAEINSRLNGQADTVCPVFEAADEVHYTGRAWTSDELREWRDFVNLALQKLEAL